MNYLDEVLVAMRQVSRASDVHSKYLAKTTSLTAPQILLMQTIGDSTSYTVGELAQRMNLSQATVTSIVDRLEKRGIMARHRATSDKRRVYVQLTPSGQALLKTLPFPLQAQFAQRFLALEEWEQALILSTFKRVALMMHADAMDAAVLTQSTWVTLDESSSSQSQNALTSDQGAGLGNC